MLVWHSPGVPNGQGSEISPLLRNRGAPNNPALVVGVKCGMAMIPILDCWGGGALGGGLSHGDDVQGRVSTAHAAFAVHWQPPFAVIQLLTRGDHQSVVKYL